MAKATRSDASRQSRNPQSAGNEPPSPAEAAARKTLRWARFDAALRLLTLAAFIAFTGLVVWNIRLLNETIERREQGEVANNYWRLSRPGTEAADRKEAFLRLVAAGNEEWRGARLTELELETTSLSSVKLKYAHFDSCRFENVQMYDAVVSPGSFRLCVVTDSQLDGVDLREAVVFKSEFTNCTMNRAQMTKCNLEQSTLKKVNLSLAEMPESEFLLAVFEDCNLSGANLTEGDLTNARFVRTDLRGARLTNCLFRSTDFTDSNWWRARGMPRILLDDNKRRYPPTENAPKEFRDDYEIWLKEQ